MINRRSRNLWVLLPKARPINLGLEQQPPAEAIYWTLEGDSDWHPMPAGWPAQASSGRPAPPPRRGKHNPAPGQGTLWQSGVVEPLQTLPRSKRARGRAKPASEPAQPILRWPGGKRYLLKELGLLLAGFPAADSDYLEPMVGGGAVFWKFGERFKTRTIGDLNPHLINLYRLVRQDVEGLITELQTGAYDYHGKSDPASRARFKALLRSEPDTQVLAAARYLFLNRSCFGAMLRTVRGKLAASPNPIGATICDPGRLRACSHALQGVQILRGSAAVVIRQAARAHPERNFLLVVDPPYHDPDPRKFVNYSGDFTEHDQAELVRVMLASKYRFIYTNKATDFILSLFADAPGITRRTRPLRHKIGAGKCRVEQELLVHNLAHPV